MSALPVVVALACQGNLSGASDGAHPGGSPLGASGASNSGGASSSGGSAALPPSTTPTALLPARIRRLSNAEFEASVEQVVGNTTPVTTSFVPDSRQSGFTTNDAQIVDSVLIKQIAGAATILAAQVRAQLDSKAPCASPTTQAEACATSFINSFAGTAYRRPLSTDEVAHLLVLYHAGADGATYADGIEEVASGVLQSAAFLYLTELGDGTPGSVITLTPYEIASQMSYLLNGGPPSKDLLDLAVKKQLATATGRKQAIDDLLLLRVDAARDRVVRVVREWLGIDQLPDTAKDTTAYPQFAKLKPAMVAETTDFISQLVEQSPEPNDTSMKPLATPRTVGELLGADWTATQNSDLATFYGVSAPGSATQPKILLPTRRGILNQGAFLSVYAHASETGPVLRGVALLRRVTCVGVASPATQKITVVPLVPDPTKTTRQRLSQHVTDPVCAGCHTNIDNFGLAFELYDGMGNFRTQDNMLPVDSHVTIAVGKEYDGDYADSNALALALAKSPSVRECFVRNIFRASAARSDDTAKSSEDAFVQYWQSQEATVADEANKGDIISMILDYVSSPAFTTRRAQ